MAGAMVAAMLSIACSSDNKESVSELSSEMADSEVSPTIAELYVESDTVDATATAVADRQSHCEANALPSPTPEPDTTPTPVPTPPISITSDDIPQEWLDKINEIEIWVRDYYGASEENIGDGLGRRFVDESVWSEWMSHIVREARSEEEADSALWEQVYKTLTLLDADSSLIEFEADFYSDTFIGFYNDDLKEIVLRIDYDEFDLGDELTYVHEYSHLVQYAIYDVETLRECYSADHDAWNSVTALVEGDATQTELAYIEEVIGEERFNRFYADYEDETVGDKSAMHAYSKHLAYFPYRQGPWFVFWLAVYLECPNCNTERRKIEDGFRIPPVTSEQVMDFSRYEANETREVVSIPDDVMGNNWEHRYASTVGKADWIALLAALTDGEFEEVAEAHPGWLGDYALLLRDDQDRGIYISVARWNNKLFVNNLVDALDNRQELIRTESIQQDDFNVIHIWDNVTSGNLGIAMSTDVEDRIRTMVIVVGPDQDTVEAAISAARSRMMVE